MKTTTQKTTRKELVATIKAKKSELENAENAIPPFPKSDLHDLRESLAHAESDLRKHDAQKKTMTNRNEIAMTTEQATEIVEGFLHLVRGRSAVRLDFRDYGDREFYLQDRNTIRRQTLAFDKAWREIAWRNKHDLACALIVACKPSRIEWNAEKKTWSYCVGLYQPTEIRSAGESVVKHAKRILG